MRIRADSQRVAGVLIFLAVVAAGVVLWTYSPVEAQSCGGGGDVGDVGSVWGSCTGKTPGKPPTSNQKAIWEHYCINTEQAEEWGFVWQDVPDLLEIRFDFVAYMTPDEYALFNYDPTGVYAWYTIGCISWFDEASGGPAWGWVDNGVELFEESPPVPIQTVVDRAKDKVDPPDPTLGSAPPLEDVVVKAQTWLWLDDYPWEPVEESESQGAVTVYIVATPTRVEWEMGDAGYVECSGPGLRWTPGADDAASDCHYTYEDSSAILPGGVFTGSATVVFEVEWWMDDPWETGRYMGGSGTIERTAAFTVDVDEIQAIETGG